MRSLVWAFVASLALHTFLFWTGAYYALMYPMGDSPSVTAKVVLIPPPPPPPPPDDDFGQHLSIGDSINVSPGDRPLIAPSADQSQAWFARNGGDAANISHAPVPPPTNSGDKGSGGFGRPSPQAQQSPHTNPQPPVPKPAPVVAKAPPEEGPGAPTTDAPPTVEQLEKQVEQMAQAETGGGAPGDPQPAGEVAPHNDSDSDAFLKNSAVQYQYVNGRVVPQDGRWVKAIKPDLTYAATKELILLPDPEVTFLVVVNSDGTVDSFRKIRSAGESNVDLPCEEVMPDWKFEPTKDAQGRPIPHIERVTIDFR